MVLLTIPPQTYAIMKHTGPNKTILHTYDRLHNWIENNGLTKLDAWHIERFHYFKNVEKEEMIL